MIALAFVHRGVAHPAQIVKERALRRPDDALVEEAVDELLLPLLGVGKRPTFAAARWARTSANCRSLKSVTAGSPAKCSSACVASATRRASWCARYAKFGEGAGDTKPIVRRLGTGPEPPSHMRSRGSVRSAVLLARYLPLSLTRRRRAAMGGDW